MTPPLPPWIWPTAAYIHIPFCAHHCGYCDFAVAVGKDHLRDAYLEALGCELATLGEPQSVQTINPPGMEMAGDSAFNESNAVVWLCLPSCAAGHIDCSQLSSNT